MADLAPGPLGSDLLGVHQRLQDCAQFDHAHVQPEDPPSPHVAAIQEALRQINGAQITEAKYGDQTTAAVVKFKTDNNLFTRGTRSIDPIVGIGTITALDARMQGIERRGRQHPQPSIVKTQDIFILLNGFDRPDQQGTELDGSVFAKSINEKDVYLERHFPLETIWFVGGEKPNPSGKIVERVNSIKASRPLGRVMISGGSAGGRNVLEVAESLANSGIVLTYIAIWDGAFQKADLVDSGQFDNNANFNPDNPVTLRFKSRPAVSASPAFEESFFQSFGHCLDKNQEIHGEVAHCLNHDLTKHPNVVRVKDEFDRNIIKTGHDKQKALENAHKAAFFIGRDRAQAKITAILTVRVLG